MFWKLWHRDKSPLSDSVRTTNAFPLGARVVVRGKGTGAVVEIDHEHIVIDFGDAGRVTIAAESASETLRPVASSAVAHAWMSRICAPWSDAETAKVPASLRHFHRATPEEQIEFTRTYFRVGKKLPERDKDLLLAATESIVQEIAIALGHSEDVIRRALRQGDAHLPSIIAPRPPTQIPPSPPAIQGATFQGTFQIPNAFVIGEHPQNFEDPAFLRGPIRHEERSDDPRDTLVIAARPGYWHAYYLERDDQESFLVVHESQSFEDAPATSAGSVIVEGGGLAFISSGLLSDPGLGPDEVARLEPEGSYGEYGLQVATGGDGVFDVFVDGPEGARTIIYVPF